MVELNTPVAHKPIEEAAVGDFLAVPGRQNGSLRYVVQSVTRLTNMQIVTQNDRRFRRTDGREIAPSPGTRSSVYAVVVGLEYVEAFKRAQADMVKQRELRNWLANAGMYEREYPVEVIDAMKNACDKWFQDHPDVKKPYV